MPNSLTNNFNNISGSASNIESSVTGFGNTLNQMKNPNNFGSASINLANSAINLAGSVSQLSNSINGLFYVDRDVVQQNMNIMRGNHYIAGYENIIKDPTSLLTYTQPFLTEEGKNVLGFSNDIRTQPLVEYDMENFKYTMDRKDNTDSWYEDPLYQSFDIIFDRTLSPLFNGEIDKFFEVYDMNDYMNNAWIHYKKFNELFFKIFNGLGPQKYQTTMIPTGVSGMMPITVPVPDNNVVKRNKVWYINSIAGMDKLTAKIPKYEEDKLTITLSEDVAMLVNYMVDSYNNFVYNYSQQRYNLPDNLLRFKMMIRLSDMRTMKLVNHFESPEYMYDKAMEIYTLYDCNFDFFNSKNFTDEVVNGGFGAGRQDTPAIVKFDIIYKSIQKEFRTPLIKGERNNVVDNKEIESSQAMINMFREKLGRTTEEVTSMKDILSGAFGAITSLNNMMGNIIPKFQPPIPHLPPDVLGSSFDNTNNQVNQNPNQMKSGDLFIRIPDPTLDRKELINRFTEEMAGYNNNRILTAVPNLGNDYEQLIRNKREEKLGNDYDQITTSHRQTPLGFDYQNDGTPTHDDLGFISLFLRPPQNGPLGNEYENIGYVFHPNLGFDYTNDGTPTHGDLGVDYSNTGNIPAANLGFDYSNIGNIQVPNLGEDYLNTGIRVPLTDILLFDKKNTNQAILGYLYTNISELRDVSLNTLYDNSVERKETSLGDLYSNIFEKNIQDLGSDFNNDIQKAKISEIPNIYENIGIRQILPETTLFSETEKQTQQDLGSDFTNDGIKQVLPETTLFTGTDKLQQQNLGYDFTNDGIKQVLPETTLFTGTDKLQQQNLRYDFTNDGIKQVLPETTLFTGTDKLQQQNLGYDFTNDGSGEEQFTIDNKNVNVEIKKSQQNLGYDFTNDGSGEEQFTIDNKNINEQIKKPQQNLGFTIENKNVNGEIKKSQQNLGYDFTNNNIEEKKDIILNNVYDNTIEKNKQPDLNILYDNEMNKFGNLNVDDVAYYNTNDYKSKSDLGSDYNNDIVSNKQGLDGDTIDESVPEKKNQELGESYENNLIEE